jgi:hypothetical protein
MIKDETRIEAEEKRGRIDNVSNMWNQIVVTNSDKT